MKSTVSTAMIGTIMFKSMLGCAVIACVIYAGLDIAARFFFHPDKYDSPNKSWIWWTVKDFRKETSIPDGVLFGSSLVVAAQNGGDARYTNQSFDTIFHHHPIYFEKALSKQAKKPLDIFSFALGGQMASDAYAIEKNLLIESKSPKLIVWGIAPRDLLDSSFTSPASSETFRYVSKLSSTPIESFGPENSFQPTKLLDRFSYIYRERDYIEAAMKSSLEPVLQIFSSKKFLQPVQKRKAILDFAQANLPEDVHPDEYICKPFEANREGYIDNSAEYRARYQPFNKATFDSQVAYLNQFLERAKEHSISVVLVNMPITRENMQILPQGIYALYLQNLKTAAKSYGARLIDLNSEKYFRKVDFFDSVHLKANAGMRLFDLIAKNITETSK
jgi:hypothetical protein